jgi:hypothetical protein
MTRASHQRIAKRAASHEPQPFAMPPSGMLSEQIDLVEFNLVLGLIHPEGSPLLIVAWDGERFRRMLPEQASQLADDLIDAGYGEAMTPAIEAIRSLVRRVGEIVTAAIMRRESLAEMKVEGNA